jgi:hypothetical protein
MTNGLAVERLRLGEIHQAQIERIDADCDRQLVPSRFPAPSCRDFDRRAHRCGMNEVHALDLMRDVDGGRA